MPIALPPSLDLGKLLRLRGMVTAAALTEAAQHSAAALVRAYNGLVDELNAALAGNEAQDLRDEFRRLFPHIQDPGVYDPIAYEAASRRAKLESAAAEARTRLSQLGGWIQGLVDELTFDQRLQLQAEADARERAKPQVGFGSS